MEHERHFTVAEANDLLPWVAEQVAILRRAVNQLLASDVGPLAPQAAAAGGSWPGREHAHAAVSLVLTLEKLDRLDIVVRDLDRGLVDFPSLIDGEEVYLCWRFDEPAVSHWHRLESGFTSRRPLG